MKAIAMFNNKGGVGKTTLLCNLSSYLAIHKEKRVLVIDCDPQCNATQSMFTERQLAEMYNSKKTFTIYSVVQPLAAGKGFTRDVEHLEIDNFGVDLIPGDPSLSLSEDVLSADWITATSGDVRGLRTTFLFAQLLTQCKEYDYVFFDMGPTLGAINRAVLLACDFFITPLSTDIFSLRAFDNISKSLVNWRKRLENGLELTDDIDELEVENPEWHLKFLGYITQQYTTKTVDGQRRAVAAYERIMNQIPNRIHKEIVEKLNQDTTLDYELGTIPALYSLIPLSQTSRKPIFELKGSDGVVGAHFTKVKEYAAVVNDIATRFENQVEAME